MLILLKVIKPFKDNDNNCVLRKVGETFKTKSIERAKYLSIERKLVNIIMVEKEEDVKIE